MVGFSSPLFSFFVVCGYDYLLTMWMKQRSVEFARVCGTKVSFSFDKQPAKPRLTRKLILGRIKVKSRRHRVDKVFPAMFGSSGFEYMLNGTVDLEMKSGEMVVVEWAGQAALGEFGGEFRGELRFLYYRVWL